MRISKFAYLLISCILMLSFWEIRPIVAILNTDIALFLTLAWAVIGFFLFRNEYNLPVVFFKKYSWILILIFAGIFLSMFNAYLFWGQEIMRTFVVQRYTYPFILVASLIHVQPSIRDIVKVLRIVSYITLCAWILGTIAPGMFINISEDAIERQSSTTDIGFTVQGIHLVALYTYYLIYKYLKHFTTKNFLSAFFWIGFIFLYQNRSLIIGALIAFIYSLTKLRSKNKILLVIGISFAALIFVFYTWDIWTALITETSLQLTDKDYNRWRSLDYYLTEYSPNLWCYLFGNGVPVGESEYGLLCQYNMSIGIYTSDIGMIGMWAIFGILPLIGIYYALVKILFGKNFPLWLKFMSLHIIFVPTIFHFESPTIILLFVLILYLYMYYCELPHFRMYHSYINKYGGSNHYKLQN